MGETADRYRRLAEGFTARVLAVPAGGWERPAPCDGWTARDVVAHIVQGTGRLFQLIGREAPGGPGVERDPVGAWVVIRDAVTDALGDPEVAGAGYESQVMGRGTFEQAVDRFGNFDLLVHTWDLARAAGLDERLDAGEVHRLFQAVQPMDEMLRTPGVCGPKVSPPRGADEQTQLLAFLGRAV